MSVKEEYTHLVADIKKHIQQEYRSSEWLGSDAETHRYFRQYALQQKAPETKIVSAAPINPTAPIKNTPLQPIKPPPAPLKPILKKIEPPKPIPVEEKQPEQPKGRFQLQPLSSPAHADLSDFRRIVQEVAPSYPIIDQIPSDAPEIVILVSDSPTPFILQVARAIDILLAPVTISKTLPKHPLKLILATYPCEQAQLVIAPYIKDPAQKARLWHDIKQHL